jgi:hypothetical protein
MNPRPIIAAFLTSLLASATDAETPNTRREIEKAAKETFPRAVRSIEQNVDAKVSFEVDTASFGDDEKAWSNLYIIANRVIGALGEVGKDQVGKDAIARSIQKILIVKLPDANATDSIDLHNGTLTVKSTGTDPAMALLQGIITRSLEKTLLGVVATPEKTP